MLAQVSTWTAKIYPKHLWEGQDGFDAGPLVNAPVGSGPFKFVRWEKGGLVELEANKDYFRGPPKLDRLVFRQVTDVNVARAEFDSGPPAVPQLRVCAAARRGAGAAARPEGQGRLHTLAFQPRHPDQPEEGAARQAAGAAGDRPRDRPRRHEPARLQRSVEDGGPRERREPGRAGSTATPSSRPSTRRRPRSSSTRPACRAGAGGWRFDVSVTNPNFPDCKADDGGAGAAAPPGRHQREAGAVRPGDLVPPPGREAVRHLLLLHPLRSRPGRLPRALRDRRRSQQHELLEPRARRARPEGGDAAGQGRAAAPLPPYSGDHRRAICPTSTCSTSRRRPSSAPAGRASTPSPRPSTRRSPGSATTPWFRPADEAAAEVPRTAPQRESGRRRRP